MDDAQRVAERGVDVVNTWSVWSMKDTREMFFVALAV